MATRMASLVLVALLACAGTILPAQAGPAEDAQAAYDAGNARAREGDFEAAAAAYEEAARLEPENQVYRGEAAIIKRVMAIRAELAGSTDRTQMERNAFALRAYYYSKEAYAEALDLDRRHYEMVGSAVTAAMLGETLLALDRDEEAVALFAGYEGEEGLSPRGRILEGIALARTGEVEQAKTIAAEVEVPTDSPQLLLLYARLQAATGENEDAAGILAHVLEATPPNVLDLVRDRVRTERDFAAMAGSAEFARALETPSKVAMSSCSQGPSCGGCPSRSSCAAGKKAEGEKSGAAGSDKNHAQ